MKKNKVFKHIGLIINYSLFLVLFIVGCNNIAKHTTYDVVSWGDAFVIDNETIGAIKSHYKYDFPNGDIGGIQYYDGGVVGIYTYNINTKEVVVNKLIAGCTAAYSNSKLVFGITVFNEIGRMGEG